MLELLLKDHKVHQTFGQYQTLVVLENEKLKIALEKKEIVFGKKSNKVANIEGVIPNHPFGKGLHGLPSNNDFKETASSMVIGILPL